MYRGFFRLSLGRHPGRPCGPGPCRRALPFPTTSIRSPAACSTATSCGPAAPSETGRAPTNGRSATSSSAPISRHGILRLVPAAPRRGAGRSRLAARCAWRISMTRCRGFPTTRRGRSATPIACLAISSRRSATPMRRCAAYEKSYALGWNPEPGHALLLLERGETEAAYASLERSLIGQNWWTLQRQGMLLAHLALVAAHTGRHEKAQALINDLGDQEQRWPMPSIRALTNEAAALIARERGEPRRGAAPPAPGASALDQHRLAAQRQRGCGCRSPSCSSKWATRAVPQPRSERRWRRRMNSIPRSLGGNVALCRQGSLSASAAHTPEADDAKGL